MIRVTRVEVAAARVKLAVDRKLGRTTPAWVRQLAAVDTRSIKSGG